MIDKELPAEAPTLMEDRYVARVQWLHYNQPAYKLYTQLFGVFIQRKLRLIVMRRAIASPQKALKVFSKIFLKAALCESAGQ